MTNTYFNNILKSFINDSVASKKREDTIKAYVSDLNKFFEFLNRDFKQIKDFSKIKRLHITSFINYLRVEKHFKDTSIDRCVYCLRSFFKYLNDSDIIETIPPILTQRYNKTKVISKIKTLTPEEISQIANAFEDSKNPKQHYMFKALIYVFAATGARRSEVINLKWQDIDLYNKQISFEKLKNSSSDFIPIHDTLFNALIEYRENCVDFCQGYYAKYKIRMVLPHIYVILNRYTLEMQILLY